MSRPSSEYTPSVAINVDKLCPRRIALIVFNCRTDQDFCYPKVIGYAPARIMEQIDGKSYSHAAIRTADGLTRAMILHPVACGLAFIAFLASLGAGVIGSVLSAMIAAVAWLITLVVMAIDFALFGVCSSEFILCLRFLKAYGLSRSSRITSTKMAVARMLTTPLVCGPVLRRWCFCFSECSSYFSLVSAQGNAAVRPKPAGTRGMSMATIFQPLLGQGDASGSVSFRGK
jgi:hypothetical protein